jgi:hypothetical protein
MLRRELGYHLLRDRDGHQCLGKQSAVFRVRPVCDKHSQGAVVRAEIDKLFELGSVGAICIQLYLYCYLLVAGDRLALLLGL